MVRSWDVAQDLPRFDPCAVIARERRALLALLSGLAPTDWSSPTACDGWDVRDICLHLIGNDIGRLRPPMPSAARLGAIDFAELAARIEQDNEAWVDAARRIPASLMTDLLALTGRRVDAAFACLDLDDQGVAVAWTGTGPSPYWLDLAREYAERWVHHQQIRDAIEAAPLTARRWLHPVLRTLVLSLPRAYDDVAAPPGTRVEVWISGKAGGRWTLRRSRDRWHLEQGLRNPTQARVRLDQDVAWRLMTRMLRVADARSYIEVRGDPMLAEPATRAVAIMTTAL